MSDMGSGPYIGHPVLLLDWAIRPFAPEWTKRPGPDEPLRLPCVGTAVLRYEPRRVPVHRTPRTPDRARDRAVDLRAQAPAVARPPAGRGHARVQGLHQQEV